MSARDISQLTDALLPRLGQSENARNSMFKSRDVCRCLVKQYLIDCTFFIYVSISPRRYFGPTYVPFLPPEPIPCFKILMLLQKCVQLMLGFETKKYSAYFRTACKLSAKSVHARTPDCGKHVCGNSSPS